MSLTSSQPGYVLRRAAPEPNKRALYVGGLDPRVTEDALRDIFETTGHVQSVKIIPDKTASSPSFNSKGFKYGFVEYDDPGAAERGMATLNGRRIHNNEIRVNWAYQYNNTAKEDTSNHFHIFVGDLSNEVNDEVLLQAFSTFGPVSEARVMWDMKTGRPRGSGFVAFRDRADADRALSSMDGEWLGSRAIRCNWANQKGQPSISQQQAMGHHHFTTHGVQSYDMVVAQTLQWQTMCCVGNLTPYTSQRDLVPLFQNFGHVTETRFQSDRRFAFIKMDTHENAAMAICQLNGYYVNDRPLKCHWPAVQNRYCRADVSTVQDSGPVVQVEVCVAEATVLRRSLYRARVVASETLSSSEDSVKKHLEIALPQNMSYRAGDCLAILPQNPRHVVRRALNLLGLSGDSVLTISSATSTALPLHTPMRAAEVLRAYVELEPTASKKNILDLLKATDDETTAAELQRLAGEAHYKEVVVKRLSLLDLLERFPDVHLSPGAFLSMQPPMNTRQYCISSSPLWNASCATVTCCAADGSATHAPPQASGLASAYLSSLAAGDEVSIRVEECADKFRMPEAADEVPLVLVAAGTGIAPFRSFVQERAAQLATGRTLPAALLFYGCRSRADHLYFDSFQRWQQLGAVAVHHAYSRTPDQSQGCRYVQDRVSQDRAAVAKLLMAGARIAVCVPECAVAGVRETLDDVLRETREARTQRAALEGQSKSTEVQPADVQLESTWHVWKSASTTEV